MLIGLKRLAMYSLCFRIPDGSRAMLWTLFCRSFHLAKLLRHIATSSLPWQLLLSTTVSRSLSRPDHSASTEKRMTSSTSKFCVRVNGWERYFGKTLLLSFVLLRDSAYFLRYTYKFQRETL